MILSKTKEWKGLTLKDAKRQVGKGWHPILEKLYRKKPRDTVVVQVKEKFGGLRFYTGGTTEEFLDLIDEAEKASYVICERCGEKGEMRPELGWIKTLCDNCLKEWLKEKTYL